MRAAEPFYDINVPATNAADALNRFAEQTGAILLFPYDLARTRQANSVRGRYTLLEGLQRLLEGTGLSGGLSDKRVVSISQTESSRHRGEEGDMLKKKAPIGTRIAAFLASILSVSAARGQSSDAQVDTLEEVIVTAQKRVERLSDVPISISVLAGRDLDKSTAEGITEELARVPGVATTQTWQGAGTQVAMRGVTAGGPLFNGASPIGYYLDSVPFGLVKTAIAPDSNAFDLERVEVLRGPQGTLYGASAMNGVVRVLTHDADLNQFEMKARVAASSTQDAGLNYRGDAAFNAPIVEGKLGARLVLGYQDLSGWIDRPNDRDANDGEVRTARLKLNAQPTDALSIGLTAWFSRSDFGAPSTGSEPRRNTYLAAEPIVTDYDVFGLRVGYDFSAFSIASSTSYVDYQNDSYNDFIGFALPSVLFTGLDSNVFTQELNLNSTPGGSWRWSLGGVYRDGKDRLLQLLPGFFNPPPDWNDVSTSTAVFGELTRLFLDGRFELTAGLRHFEDKVKLRQNQSAVLPLLRTDDKFSANSPRFVATWHPSRALTVYASYAEGFRSGFNQNPDVLRADAASANPQYPPMKADTLKNYEIGSKGSLLDGKVSVDAAAYYIDWQDVQQTRAVVINGIPFFAFANGDSASGVGLDFALSYLPGEGLQLGLNANWNDLQWDKDVISGGELLFAKGERLNYSPEYTIGASADYAFGLSTALTGRLSLSANYASAQAWRTVLAAGAPRINELGDAIFLGRVSFAVSAADRWTGTLFVDNVSNEQGTPVRSPYGLTDWSARLRPRTIGMQLEYRF